MSLFGFPDDDCTCSFCSGLFEKVEGTMMQIDSNLVIGWADLAIMAVNGLDGWPDAFPEERMAQYQALRDAAIKLLQEMTQAVAAREAKRVSQNHDGRWN